VSVIPRGSIVLRSLPGESSSRQSIRKENKGGRCDEVLDLIAKKLQFSSEGKFSAYAKYIGEELETLPKEMAVYCQRVINEANFGAQMCSLTLRRLMSYVYGAPILDVSRSHTTTQHSR